jgi:predicted nucleotidyltransferase
MLYNYHINQTTLKVLGLFRSDYWASFHLREIARGTKVDAKAVSVQLNRLEKANTLTSTLKGRNKEYRLNLGNYLTLYYLVLAETFVTVDYLSRNFEVKKLVSETAGSMGDSALLFGGFVKGDVTQESDIDILIIDDKKPDLGAFREVGSLLGREVNVKYVSEEQFSNGLVSKDPLIWEVVANHIILKGIDNICGMLWRYYARR